MSERKVLSKYFPPDFDPSAIVKTKKKKQAGPAVQTIRNMAPMSMRCTRCGEYIYKGRKFNARKETPVDEKYLGIQIYRFYIRCTRCHGEIIYRSDPKNKDYVIISGAKRNVEPWYQQNEETDEQRLERLAAEEAAANGEAADGLVAEQNRMEELEAKTLEARREMDVADKLDEIRTHNARLARADVREHLETVAMTADEDARRRQEDREDEEAARQAFAAAKAAALEVVEEEGAEGAEEEGEVPVPGEKTAVSDDGAPLVPPPPPPQADAANVWRPKPKKKKKTREELLGIKVKKKPSLV